MDCNMPIMDGYEACFKIKELEKLGKLQKSYIVACTADISEFNLKKCQK